MQQKKSIQPVSVMQEQMIAEEKQKKRSLTSTYCETASEIKSDSIKNDLSFRISQLKKNQSKCNLNSITDVKTRTIDYFTACTNAGIVPSVHGLCVHGYGYSRQYVYRFFGNNSGSETAIFFETVRDIICDIVTNESLKGNTNPVMSIFILKNNHNMSDSYRLEAIDNQNIHHEMSADELIREARMLSDPDEDEDFGDGID